MKRRKRSANGSTDDETTQVTKLYAEAHASHERVRTKARSLGVKAEALSLHLIDDETEVTPTDPVPPLRDKDEEGKDN